jgi:hypothetical protein
MHPAGMSTVVRRDIIVEPKRKLCFVLEGVYTKEECDDLIKLSEATGYEPALLNMGTSPPFFLPTSSLLYLPLFSHHSSSFPLNNMGRWWETIIQTWGA